MVPLPEASPEEVPPLSEPLDVSDVEPEDVPELDPDVSPSETLPDWACPEPVELSPETA